MPSRLLIAVLSLIFIPLVVVCVAFLYNPVPDHKEIEIYAFNYTKNSYLTKVYNITWHTRGDYQRCFLECPKDEPCLYFCIIEGEGLTPIINYSSKLNNWVMMFYCDPESFECGLYKRVFYGNVLIKGV